MWIMTDGLLVAVTGSETTAHVLACACACEASGRGRLHRPALPCGDPYAYTVGMHDAWAAAMYRHYTGH